MSENIDDQTKVEQIRELSEGRYSGVVFELRRNEFRQESWIAQGHVIRRKNESWRTAIDRRDFESEQNAK